MLIGIGIGAVGMLVMFLLVGIINSLNRNDPDVGIIMAVQDNVIAIFETEIASMKTDISEIDTRSLRNAGRMKQILCRHTEVEFVENLYTGFLSISYCKKCVCCGKILEQYPTKAGYTVAKSKHMHLEADELYRKSCELMREDEELSKS